MDTNTQFQLDKLSPEEVQNLAKEAADVLMANGVLYRSKVSEDQVEHAPFMLFPTPYPRKLYEQAKAVQKDFNQLVHRVSLDHEFLKESLQSTMAVDKFMGRIYEMYEQVRKEGIAQPISLALLRSDYMIDSDKPTISENLDEMKIKQVEINTIASSFGGLGSKLPYVGSYVMGLQGQDIPVGSPQLPHNKAIEGVPEGLAKAWEFYGSENAVVVMIINDGERNAFDQKFVEYQLHQRSPRIRMLRRSLTTIFKNAELREDKRLFLEGQEIAVVYYRAGYSPSCYPTEDTWSARLMIERSKAIKCPTMAMHLVGTKKVQQVLAEPGVLERFVSDQDALRRIRDTFTGLYTLDEGPEGDKTVQLALQDPDRYVLKPQREGGGNNIFGEDIRTTLNQMKTADERSQFILMDRIRTPTVNNYIVRPEMEKPLLCPVISEFGTFGVLISCGDKVLVSREVGHLMRTKSIEHQDGGVASGRANLDSPFLV